VNCFGSFALYHPQQLGGVGKKKIHIEALLIAKVVKLLPAPAVDLALQNLRSYVTFKKRAEKRRAVELRLGTNAQ